MSSYTAPRRPRDMLLSLAVILLPIVLILGVWRWLSADAEVAAIDPGPKYVEAADAGLDVLRPTGLGEDWRATVAMVVRDNGTVTLRVGYLTPDDSGMQVVQSNIDAADLIGAELGERPRVAGDVDAAGRAWTSYVTEDGNSALVWTLGDRTVVVIGDAEAEDLLAMAAALG